MNKIRHFIGVDQTGAVNSKGLPKALPICVFDQKNQAIQFHRISKLSWQEIEPLLPKNTKKSEVFLLIDAVLGLPSQANSKRRSLRDLLKMTEKYEFEKKPFGMMTAHQFFLQFVEGLDDIPTRKVEEITSANSLFKLHPFQKNISCGTFRIWKDLSSDLSWFQVWPHQVSHPGRAYIAEGYPSYYWKTIFNLKTRNAENLLKQLHAQWGKQLKTQKVLKDPDALDAFVLAWSAYHLIQKKSLLQRPRKRTEGWILGVPE